MKVSIASPMLAPGLGAGGIGDHRDGRFTRYQMKAGTNSIHEENSMTVKTTLRAGGFTWGPDFPPKD